MSGLNPFGDTNSRRCENVRSWTFQPLTLANLRATAGVLVDGPDDILLRHVGASTDLAFERVFRLVVRAPNQRMESWAAYRRDRHWQQGPETDDGSILRHCVWDIGADLQHKSWERGEGPDVSMHTRFVAASACARLQPLMTALDKEIQAGIRFRARLAREIPSWQEQSIWRALDWGQVDVTWLVNRQSSPIEKAALDIAYGIDRVLEETGNEPANIEMFRMVYPSTPYLVLS